MNNRIILLNLEFLFQLGMYKLHYYILCYCQNSLTVWLKMKVDL